MAGKPRRLERTAQRPVKLIAGNALLTGTHQVSRLEPLVQLQVACLENGPLSAGELAATVVTLPKAVPLDAVRVLLARLGADALERVDAVSRATVRAGRALRPQDRLKSGEGRCFIVEIGFIKNACHRPESFYRKHHTGSIGFVKYNMAKRKRSRPFKAGSAANRKGDPKAALAVSRAERRQSSIGGRPVATRSTLSISSCFSSTRPRQCSKPCPFP